MTRLEHLEEETQGITSMSHNVFTSHFCHEITSIELNLGFRTITTTLKDVK